MPGLDRSGPSGMGQMTGRGTGLCNRQNMQDNATMADGFGRGAGRGCRRTGGFGQGRGRGQGGKGFGNMAMSPMNDIELLKSRREHLRSSLEEVEKLLGEKE